ncbi:MAG: FAD-dependent oxidoreductase, partial [Bacteroidales bacterium]|nr:FAD-dependent oxidoreductase [Bacteroidales bacterium]
MFDLAILGGGPAGYVAAEKAAKGGMSVVLFEKRELGGVCLNEGCIPTKTLLYSAKLFDYARHGDKYGVSVSDASLDFPAVMKRKEKVVKKLVGGVRVRMREAAVEVVKENAFIEGEVPGGFAISAGEGRYEAARLLVCTGSEAAVPPIP